MAKVIIIGGGPAGCEAAHQLASQGIDVELVEMCIRDRYIQVSLFCIFSYF